MTKVEGKMIRVEILPIQWKANGQYLGKALKGIKKAID